MLTVSRRLSSNSSSKINTELFKQPDKQFVTKFPDLRLQRIRERLELATGFQHARA